jgi:hypothetical protein
MLNDWGLTPCERHRFLFFSPNPDRLRGLTSLLSEVLSIGIDQQLESEVNTPLSFIQF